jgi:fructose-1,6-bisphosphatase/inositol monophosphatase family enzyme
VDEDFVDRMTRASAIAAQVAAGEVFLGEVPLNSGTWPSIGISGEDVEAIFGAMKALVEFGPEDHVAHMGHRQIRADRATHVAVEAFLRTQDPTSWVAGEEATVDEWRLAGNASTGSSVYVLDAIDGSGPFEELTFGYGLTLTTYIKLDVGLRFVGALVTNSSGFYVISDGVGTFVGNVLTSHSPIQLTDPLRGDVTPSIAIVAAKSEDRVRLGRLSSEGTAFSTAANMYNVGGSPAALGMALGRLGIILCPAEQAAWDAAYLPALVALGCEVRTLDGKRADAGTIAGWLEAVGVGERPVPPFVVARGNEYANHGLALLRLSAGA